MTVLPGYSVTVSNGTENGNPNFYVCWLVTSLGQINRGDHLYRRFPFRFLPDSNVPLNFCPIVNDHVSGSNPAFQGIAVSPVQLDASNGTLKPYTHGGGTFTTINGTPQYTGVLREPQTFTSTPWSLDKLYVAYIETIYDPDPAVGLVRMWIVDQAAQTVTKIADGHASTFYNQDAGPLDQYGPGIYTKGGPTENPQAHNDNAVFKTKFWMPQQSRLGWTDCFASTPAVFDHARGALNDPVLHYTCVPCETLDSSTFLVPPELGVSSPPPVQANVPPGFETTAIDFGGAAINTTVLGELQASVPSAADTADTAVGIHDFGTQTGRVYVRDIIRLDTGQTLADNLAFLQVLDPNGALVYELYLDASRTILLWSPGFGLGGIALNQSTGFVVPNDGVTNTRVEVSALINNSIVVRVEGVDLINISGLSGATTMGQKSLRAGIDHYDGSSTSQVMITHGSVATSLTDWLGVPVVTPPPPPPDPDPPPVVDPPPPPPPPDPALLAAALAGMRSELATTEAAMATARKTLSDCNEQRLRLVEEVATLSKALEILTDG